MGASLPIPRSGRSGCGISQEVIFDCQTLILSFNLYRENNVLYYYIDPR